MRSPPRPGFLDAAAAAAAQGERARTIRRTAATVREVHRRLASSAGEPEPEGAP